MSLAILCSAPAGADTLSDAEDGSLPRVIDMQCLNVGEDPGCEQVYLLQNADRSGSVDLIIMHMDHSSPTPRWMPGLVARDLVSGSLQDWELPGLEQGPDGALRVTSQQTGRGPRTFWSLTITFQDGAFMVTGLQEDMTNALTLDGQSCELNFNTGTYRRTLYFEPADDRDAPSTMIRPSSSTLEGALNVAPIPAALWESTGRGLGACSNAWLDMDAWR